MMPTNLSFDSFVGTRGKSDADRTACGFCMRQACEFRLPQF
jgi:hypothetical protein